MLTGGAQVAENKRAIGRVGEDAAQDFLTGLGYQILYRNFRYGKYGEIDIIALYSSTICFIEVKSRSGAGYGTPAEAVGYAKRKKIMTVANHFLRISGYKNYKLRFDIIEVFFIGAKTQDARHIVKRLHHIENAFGE